MTFFYLLVFSLLGNASVDLESREWRPPNYESQENVLGYSKDTFSIPEDLEDRVQFWVNIYTKYNTNQGILHDSKHLDLVYEQIDFSQIEQNTELTLIQIEKEKKKLIKERKKYLENLFLKFQTIKTPDDLPENEKKIWTLFEKIDEPNKFIEASKRGRLRLQMGLRDRFIQAIYDSGKYLEQMEAIFRDNSLPLELTRLPFVESSFNLSARSKSGASGIWQIMPRTGRRMMKVNHVVDERNEPIEATRAAARILKLNYDELRDWSMAVTAYNFGVAGMKRVIKKTQAENLTDILGKRPTRRFGFASSSFYASFLAALIVEKDAKKYYGDVKWSQPLLSEDVLISKSIYMGDFLSVYNQNFELAMNLNPHLNKRVFKNIFALPKGTKIKVPVGKAAEMISLLDKHQESHSIASVDVRSYKVAPGDTLYDISKMFKVSLDQIIHANENLDPRRLRPGQTISIP